jgi:hypothetical protein
MATDKNATAPTTPTENLVMMDVNVLAATIATAVAQALAANKVDNSELGTTIGAAVAQGIAATTRRKVTFGEYDARGPRNFYHPKSKAETPKLKREFYQNDTFCHDQTLMDREITLLNRITHSGRYMNRLVEVITSEDAIRIRYNNKTPDQKMELKNFYRSLVELLEIVVKEQEAEDKEAKELAEDQLAERQKREAAREARGRTFGSSKNTLDAIEKAGQ